MSKELQQKPRDLKDKILAFNSEISKINPDIKSPMRFMELVYHEWAGNEQLQKCSLGSLLYSAKTSAELGMLVGKQYGQGWIIPYYNNKLRVLEAQFQLGYKGIIILLKRAGYTVFPPQCICKGDKYKIDIANSKIMHELDLEAERGEPLAWYARVKDDATGTILFDRMSMSEINKRRDKSLEKIKPELRKYSPWEVWYEEMCAKTVIRKLTHILPINDELRAIFKADEEREAIIGNEVEINPMEPEIEYATEQKPINANHVSLNDVNKSGEGVGRGKSSEKIKVYETEEELTENVMSGEYFKSLNEQVADVLNESDKMVDAEVDKILEESKE